MSTSARLTVVDSGEVGYKPVWDYEQWRIAITNDSPQTHEGCIHIMARHMLTDEAFILLEGQASLLIGSGGHQVEGVERFDMQKGKVYVVHKATWHASITAAGTKVLIVENRDTSPANTEKVEVDPSLLG